MDEDHRVVYRWDRGFGWMAHPEEFMQRTSHAIASDQGVWLVDPLDMDGLGALLDEHGPVAGVVLTLDRHRRDAATLASEHEVAIHTPEALMGSVRTMDVPITTTDRFAAVTGFDAIPVVSVPGWREYALYDRVGGTLICADAIGSASYFLGPGKRLGVHPMLRIRPPRDALGSITAERVLTGHGPGVLEDGTNALHEALADARREAPFVYARMLARAPRIFY